MIPVSNPILGPREQQRVSSVLKSGRVTQGPEVAEFEDLLSALLEVEHASACSSGTAALHLALAALCIGPGDEVLVPDLTYIATANAVRYVGATPILVDVDPITWNIDLDKAATLVTKRTKAVIVVHLYGSPCDMGDASSFSLRHGLFLIEDAAEAFGGAWNGKACGTIGDIGTFSFYANKIISTGEGGAVVTNSSELDARVRLLRGQGQGLRRFFHETLGFNYRMTEMQAAIGIVQLEQFGAFLDRRMEIFEFYQSRTKSLLEFPVVEGASPWLFTGLLRSGVRRDEVVEYLSEYGVETRPMFYPLHEQPMYEEDGGKFPISSLISPRGISLPTYVSITDEELSLVCMLLEGAAEHCQ